MRGEMVSVNHFITMIVDDMTKMYKVLHNILPQ